MVDPNRKINRLTDKDIEFLEECEEEFSQRYTEVDDEFLTQCMKPLPPPPIVDNWTASGGGGNSNYYKNRSGSRNQRNWCSNYNRRDRSKPYHINNRPDYTDRGSSGDNVSRSGKDTDFRASIRRDYNSFVAASHD